MSRGQGRVYQPKGARYFWLDYGVRGGRHRESSGTTNKTEAQRMLRQKIGDRESGKVTGRPERVLLAEYAPSDNGAPPKLVGGLRWLHETQYDLDGLRSKVRAVQCWAHLEAFFGAATRAADLSPTRLDAYATARLGEGAARQTINTELSALRRGFKLAIAKGLLVTMPTIELPKVENARAGFFEDADFAALLLELPAELQPVVRFLRFTGWRATEPLALTWDQVDWEGGTIRLTAADTKTKEGRVFPFGLAPDLKALLEAQWAARNGVFVFHRGGERITYDALEHQWDRARKRAGTDRIMHDLRRSAARDFRRAGVSEGEIMRLCGWRTRSMFDRYNVIDEADLAVAVGRRFAPNGKGAAKSSPSDATPEALSSTPVTREG
jgi:integrase